MAHSPTVAPTTPSAAHLRLADTSLAGQAQALLEKLAGNEALLRPEQLTAIEVAAGAQGRALVVQRTGFGKSAIYFIATRLRRNAGAGPTLVVSPLLALMRDQVAAAEKMGVRSATINSTNIDEWSQIEADIARGDLDLICISPERLNNPGFVDRVLPRLAKGLGLLVIDEAHCISDWGHDFRPDYRRIRDAIANLTPGTPVLATTATANGRVCTDVADQLGDQVTVLRGTLDRESLSLGVAELPTLAHRLAWLAQRIPEVEGTGIVYCLTVSQTAEVAEFLRGQGIDARAYSGQSSPEERLQLEAAFKANELKVLVATSALGMGVDKPDVTFVFHLGAPPSPIAYYQQVGRAGRSVEQAEAWLLPGPEDRAIWDWFASVGMPPEHLCLRVLDALGPRPISTVTLERTVDLRRSRLDTLLKILDVDGAVRRVEGGWLRTEQPWQYDTDRVERVAEARRAEAEAMIAYATRSTCLMEFLRASLDDPGAARCGRCMVCTGSPDPVSLDAAIVRSAIAFLRGIDIEIEPRKQWARGLDEPRGNLKPAQRAELGRAMCRVQDAGWWPVVAEALATNHPPPELLDGVIATLKRWRWEARPRWVTWIPSTQHDPLLRLIAEHVGSLGKLPVHQPIQRARTSPPQASTENSAHRLANVWGAFGIDLEQLPEGDPLDGPVLVIDDMWDSGWTMTVVAEALRRSGAGSILPLALAHR